MMGLLPVSTVSFCSGATVLCMSCASLIRGRHDGIQLQIRTSTPLAVGAVCGGLAGKWMFEFVRSSVGNEHVLGVTQAVCLTFITFCIFLYVCNKNKLSSKQVKNAGSTIVIGIFLGIISSFLGIGGGTSNVAVLYFFFSMNAKEAAKNSLYIIIFSQLSSIIVSILTHSVPTFQWIDLIAMATGGVSGALIGAVASQRINNEDVENILKIMLLVITLMDFYNVLKYSFL